MSRIESDKAKQNAAEKTATDKAQDDRSFKQIILDEVKFFAGLLVFLLIFFNFIFGHYKIPSESMQPTLEVGDHLYVNKFSYGFSRHSLIGPLRKLPFLWDGRILAREPNRGDVVVFRSPTPDPISGKKIVLIKRLVGLPGDRIEYRKGRLYIDDEMIERTFVADVRYRDHLYKTVREVTKYSEQFPGEKRAHEIYERSDFADFDNVGPWVVPEGKYFFIGDNRDNSGDSRAPGGPGLVPFENFIGKAQMMVFSLKRCKEEQGIDCPGFRALKKL